MKRVVFSKYIFFTGAGLQASMGARLHKVSDLYFLAPAFSFLASVGVGRVKNSLTLILHSILRIQSLSDLHEMNNWAKETRTQMRQFCGDHSVFANIIYLESILEKVIWRFLIVPVKWLLL